MRTGIRRVTVAELHADTEAIIAELPHAQGIEVFSPEGEHVAQLAGAVCPSNDPPAKVLEAMRAFMGETKEPSTWLAPEAFWSSLLAQGWPLRIPVASLHAHLPEIMRELPTTDGIELFSPTGDVLGILAPIPPPGRDLTPEEAAAVMAAFAQAETEDPSLWLDHDEVMKMFDDLDDKAPASA